MTAMLRPCPASWVPTQRDRDQAHELHAHRYDLTPALVAADPDPAALYADLVRVYGTDSADLLVELAAEVQIDDSGDVCPRCGGEGVVYDHSSRNPAEHWDRDCGWCDGEGFLPNEFEAAA